MFRFRPLTQADAEAIAGWRYPGEYAFYDWSADVDDERELLTPALRGDAYVAADDDDGELVGFFSFKHPAPGTVELGLGLRPDRTGRGLGEEFVEAGLEYARREYEPDRFTLAVATFNRRAITVYERTGFEAARTYLHRTNGSDWEFLEMQRPA